MPAQFQGRTSEVIPLQHTSCGLTVTGEPLWELVGHGGVRASVIPVSSSWVLSPRNVSLHLRGQDLGAMESGTRLMHRHADHQLEE